MFLFVISFKTGCNINELTTLDEHSLTYSKLTAKTTIGKVTILHVLFSEYKNVKKVLKKSQPIDTQPTKKIISLPFF